MLPTALACRGVGLAKPRTVPVASVSGYRYPHMVHDESSCTKRLCRNLVQLRGGTSRVCAWRVLAVAPR